MDPAKVLLRKSIQEVPPLYKHHAMGVGKLNSKRKGNTGERELLAVLNQYGIEAIRNDQKYIGGSGRPDILARISGEEAHIEAKRCETLKMSEWLRQVSHDILPTPNRIPVVAFRRNREQWYCTVRLDDLMRLLHIQRRKGNETDKA